MMICVWPLVCFIKRNLITVKKHICINRLSFTMITNYTALALPVEKSDHPTHTPFLFTSNDDNDKNKGNKKSKINLFPFGCFKPMNLYC